jgi:hypothetical protein
MTFGRCHFGSHLQLDRKTERKSWLRSNSLQRCHPEFARFSSPTCRHDRPYSTPGREPRMTPPEIALDCLWGLQSRILTPLNPCINCNDRGISLNPLAIPESSILGLECSLQRSRSTIFVTFLSSSNAFRLCVKLSPKQCLSFRYSGFQEHGLPA